MGVPFFLVPSMVRQFCTEPISFLDKALFHTSTACLAGHLNMLMSAIGDHERTEPDFPLLLASTYFSLIRISPTEASSQIKCHPI